MPAREKSFRIAVRRFPAFSVAIRQQWDDFERIHQTGLALEAVSFDLSDLESTLFHADGMRDGTWDVAFVPTDWIASMHAHGSALDLAPKLAANAPADYPVGWTDSLWRLQRVGESVLGVPYHDGPECLMYRRDLFEDPDLQAEFRLRFGRDLEVPATWDNFQSTARFFHRPERGVYGTAFAAFPDGHNSVYDFLLQLWSRGGELFDREGRLLFQTSQAEQALQFYRALLTDTEAVHPACPSMDSVAAGAAFAAGNIALMVNWFGFAAAAHHSSSSAVRGQVAVAPVPCGLSGTSVSLNVYWILAIASGTLHRAEAWSFLKHVLTPQMDKLTTLSGAIGCRRSTWSDPEVNATIPFYHRIADMHVRAREIPQRFDWPEIATIIDGLTTAALSSKRPIEALLRDADAKARRLTRTL